MLQFVFLVGAVSFSLAHDTVRIMLESINSEARSEVITFEGLAAPVNYTFSPGTACFTIASDGSYFAEESMKRFYRMKSGPQFVSGPQTVVANCTSFIALATDRNSLKSVVRVIGRQNGRRVLALIENGDLASSERYFKKESHLFGEAEVALFFTHDLKNGYKIAQPPRNLKKISLSDENAEWGEHSGIANFQARKMVISTRNCSIFVRIGEIDGDGSTRLFGGIEAKILNDIAHHLNFTYKFLTIDSGPPAASGELVNVSSWPSGLVEPIVQGLADAAFCGLWPDHRKLLEGLEMSRPVQSMCVTYLVPRPSLKNASWKIVLTPFDSHLWMVLTATMIGFSVLIKGASLASRKILGDPSSEYESFEYNMLIVFGILSATSWPKFRQLMAPLKHLISWWILFSILLNTSYSTTLISNLYTPKHNPKPSTIADLVEDGYLWRTEMRFPGESLWDVTQRQYNRWMSRQRILPPNSTYGSSSDDSYSKQAILGVIIGKTFSPLAVTTLPLDYFSDYEVMDKCVATVYETFFFKTGSPLVTGFNACLRKLDETGIVEHYRHQIPYFAGDFPTKSLDKALSVKSELHPISFSHISGIFGILGYGYLFSLCVLVLEVLYYRLTTTLVIKKRTV